MPRCSISTKAYSRLANGASEAPSGALGRLDLAWFAKEYAAAWMTDWGWLC